GHRELLRDAVAGAGPPRFVPRRDCPERRESRVTDPDRSFRCGYGALTAPLPDRTMPGVDDRSDAASGRPADPASLPFRIGPWRVEPGLNRLDGPTGEVAVEPRVMEVLVCLARHAGETV